MFDKTLRTLVVALAALGMAVSLVWAGQPSYVSSPGQRMADGVGVYQGRPDLHDPQPAPAPRHAEAGQMRWDSEGGVGVYQGRSDLHDPQPAPAPRRAEADRTPRDFGGGVGVYQGRPDLYDPQAAQTSS